MESLFVRKKAISGFQAEYDIPRWKFDPTASVEMFNDNNGIQKMRYQFGVDYKYKKYHVFSLSYRFQNINSAVCFLIFYF